MKKSKAPQKKAEARRAAFSQLGEFRVLTLREVPTFGVADNPKHIAEYYRKNIATDPRINADVETLVCIALTTRREVLGHYIVATGTLDTLLCHPREAFRAAIVANAAAIVVIHNHPSGDPTPSEPDIKVTRDLIRAGQILKIEVTDHIIMGRPTPSRPRDFCSLRELGYFYDFGPAPTTHLPPAKTKSVTMNLKPQICRRSTDSVNFWRSEIASKSGFNSALESFWALTLDSERRLTGAHAVSSKSFGNAPKFADELFQAEYLRGVPEFVLIHHRPGRALEASTADIERVRTVILAGRARKTELLDCIIVGKPDDAHPSGAFSFYKLKGIWAENPFVKPSKKARQASAKAEATQ